MAKRALLIGVNKYQVPGADLRGCVNDVKNLNAALIEVYGFKKSDITALTDGAATKKAMKAGIKRLVSDSKKGDIAVLHYSGHGSNVPDDNDDESDGRDEIAVPDRSRLGRSVQGRLVARHARQTKARRQLHGDHGLLPFRNQHASDPSARRAGQGAVSPEPVGPGGG